jgi:hypothetical protein
MSEFGAVPDDLNVSFNPVRIQSEKEKAENAAARTTAVMSAAGEVSEQVILKELRAMADSTGMWSNITDEDIEQADAVPEIGDVPPEGGEPEPPEPPKGGELAGATNDEAPFMAYDNADFESKHSRADGGKFGSGSENSNNPIDKDVKKQYSNILLKIKTSDGVTIKSFSKHSLDQVSKRGITPDDVKHVLQTATPSQGHTDRTRVYDKNGIRVVVDFIRGEIVTIMWRRQAK